MQHDFANGKYTVINDNGRLTALRHGEHWDRDICGDNLIYWMLVDYDKMKEQRDELLEALQAMCAEFRGHDLPYGSKAYANAVSLINNNPTH